MKLKTIDEVNVVLRELGNEDDSRLELIIDDLLLEKEIQSLIELNNINTRPIIRQYAMA